MLSGVMGILQSATESFRKRGKGFGSEGKLQREGESFKEIGREEVGFKEIGRA